MKVIFLSKLIFNAYQKLLVEHLRKCGVEVDENDGNVFLSMKTLKETAPDIIHLQLTGGVFFFGLSKLKRYGHAFRLVRGLFSARLRGVMIVCTVHDVARIKYPGKLFQLTESIICKLSHRIIVLNQVEKEKYAKILKLSLKKISVVPHGNLIGHYENKISREESRKILNVPEQSFVILFFGWIFSHKGLVELIDVFKKLDRKDAVLVIAGKINDQDYLDRIKRKIENIKNIRLAMGFIPDEQVQIYMNASDVVATPYIKFTSSGITLLAMSFGKPCIAPDEGSFKEVLDDKGAFLYDPDTKDGLSQAIAAAVEAKDNLSAMGQYNLRQAEKRGWNKIAQMTFDVYRQCLSE